MKRVIIGLVFSLSSLLALAQGSIILGATIAGISVYDAFTRPDIKFSLPPIFDPKTQDTYLYPNPKSVVVRPQIDPKLVWVDGTVFRREFMQINNKTLEVLVPQ
jgi:hypothetical protein